VSYNTLAQISLKLMQADFAARQANGGADIGVNDIQEYHRDIFQNVAGVSAEAWTANFYLNSFDTLAEKQAAWDSMISSSTFVTAAVVNWRFSDAQPGSPEEAYIAQLTAAGTHAALNHTSSEYGPFNVSIPGAGQMVGGGVGDDTVSGSEGDDILIGFDGEDTLKGGDGDDRLYGLNDNDTLMGGKGDDLLNGGNGFDTADYASGSGTTGRTTGISVTQNAQEVGTGIVNDGLGGTDTLVSIEFINGTSFDDSFAVTGSLAGVGGESQLQFDGGANGENGDTLNLSGVTSGGLTVVLQTAGDAGYATHSTGFPGFVSGDAEIAFGGIENVVGSNSNDTITGSDASNILYGGDGADSLSGGAGDDILIFDAADTVVDGGAGRDVGIVTGEAGVTVDLAAQGLEVVVGGAGADNFTLNGQGGTLQMVAGGGGVDTFTINVDNTSETVVVWGGEGADRFQINNSSDTLTDSTDPLGIMTVNIEGLTEENFADFDLDMLGLGAGFNWGAIDLVVVNSDPDDRFYTGNDFTDDTTDDDSLIRVNEGTVGISEFGLPVTDSSGLYSETMSLLAGSYVAYAVGSFDANFLNYGTMSIQTSVEVLTSVYFQPIDPDTGEPFPRGMSIYGADDPDTLEYEGDPFPEWSDLKLGTADYTTRYSFGASTDLDAIGDETNAFFWINYYSPNAPNWDDSAGPNPYGYATGVDTLSDVGTLSSPTGPWFVVGGGFNTHMLSDNGTITATMPNTEPSFSLTDWLASISGGSGTGGGNNAPSSTTNINSGSGPTTILNFDTGTNYLIFDGGAVDPTDTAAGYTLSQVGTNVEVDFGNGDVVTLENTSLANWQTAAATQNFGSAGNDVLTGTAQGETFVAGAGNDVINAASGDDTIVYTSGDDVITGHGTINYGNDTLDLSKYTADQVSFRIVGHDVFIDTPDGSIELDYQVRYDVGHSRSNIENILFSDGALDAAGIADRAIADQGNAGDDVITGSFQSETITGGTGNDVLSGVNGSDTFVFAVGDGVDHITDYNAANDTLEFTGIGFTDLTITQVGSDVLIEYGASDQLIVENSVIANFNEPEFLFA